MYSFLFISQKTKNKKTKSCIYIYIYIYIIYVILLIILIQIGFAITCCSSPNQFNDTTHINCSKHTIAAVVEHQKQNTTMFLFIKYNLKTHCCLIKKTKQNKTRQKTIKNQYIEEIKIFSCQFLESTTTGKSITVTLFSL